MFTLQPLIKAIDAYLAKAENDLYEQLTMEGYLKAKESLDTVDEIEEVVTKLLEDNADDLLKELADTIDLETFFKDNWPKFKKIASWRRTFSTFSTSSFLPSCRRMLKPTSRKRTRSSPSRSLPRGQPIG